MATPDEEWPKAPFEAKYEMMIGHMSKAEQKQAAQNTVHLCLCNKCPTNTNTRDINRVYCTFGKTDSTQEQKGCLCSDCSITKTMSMRWEYYCMRGSAVELSDL